MLVYRGVLLTFAKHGYQADRSLINIFLAFEISHVKLPSGKHTKKKTTMENHNFSNGKINYKWPFSIARLRRSARMICCLPPFSSDWWLVHILTLQLETFAIHGAMHLEYMYTVYIYIFHPLKRYDTFDTSLINLLYSQNGLPKGHVGRAPIHGETMVP